jgi:hypothetical protein
MIRSTQEFRDVFKAARRAGTPLVAVRTADPASAMAQVAATVSGKTPLAAWDLMSGLQARNEAGKAAVANAVGENSAAIGPADALSAAQKLAKDSILFFLNPQRFWEQPDVLQAIWNLRDIFKAETGGQTLVLITTPGATLPVELQSDVMLMDDHSPPPKTFSIWSAQPSRRLVFRRPTKRQSRMPSML